MKKISNPNFIGKVEDVFQISGRGLVLCLNINIESSKESLYINTQINLVKPNQEIISTSIKGIDFEKLSNILINGNFQKEDIPLGTEIWLKNKKS